MRLPISLALANLAGVFTVLASAPTLAFSYEPTPLSKAVAAHDLVLVGKVKERAGGVAKVEPLSVIKGPAPEGQLTLPDTWRPGTEFRWGPVPLEVGKTYLLMLRRDERGGYDLSRDFAADAVAPVTDEKQPLVRAAAVLAALSQQREAEARERTLGAAWEAESDETIVKLLDSFANDAADPATVPFLIRAMGAGPERSSLMERSAAVIQRHKYPSAVPGLLATLERKDWSSVYPARTLGVLKARDAYGPIMRLIEDPQVGNRPYLIEALCLLEDERAVPFLRGIL